MKTFLKIFGITLGVAGVTFIIFLFTPAGVKMMNSYKSSMQKADDESNYSTRKEVENTCRTMITSYQSDRLIYEQYKDSESSEKQSWAEQAKIRANKTASSYNNYILKNSYVWKNNVPDDIAMELEILS